MAGKKGPARAEGAAAGTGAAAKGRKPTGTAVRAAGINGPQVARSGGGQWSDEAEAAFLDALGASCNVLHAADAIGYTAATLYWRRRRDPAFAERWRAAMEQGYVRIEAALIEAAEDALAGRMPNPALPIPKMTVREAMELLRMHNATAGGRGPRTPGRHARPRPIEEVRASILAKLAAIAGDEEGAEVRGFSTSRQGSRQASLETNGEGGAEANGEGTAETNGEGVSGKPMGGNVADGGEAGDALG